MYENDNKFMVGIIDLFKGENYCRGQWLQYMIMTIGPRRAKAELKAKVFWEDE